MCLKSTRFQDRRKSDEKKQWEAEFSTELTNLGEAAWMGDAIPFQTGESVRLLGIKLEAIHNHMSQFPGDFPSELMPSLKSWMMDVRLVSHSRESSDFADFDLFLTNGNRVSVFMDTADDTDIDYLNIQCNYKTILNIRSPSELDYLHEDEWNQMIATDLRLPLGAIRPSFILRFFCVLVSRKGVDCERIADAAGSDFGKPSGNQKHHRYHRYPFFKEHWDFMTSEVNSILSTRVGAKQPLLPDLTTLVLSYAICPPVVKNQ